MQAISYNLDDQLQPTNSTCGYTALSMLLSCYKKKVSVDDLVRAVPQPKHEDGTEAGSVTTQLVLWCLQQGMKAKMWTADTQVTDLSWTGKTQEELLERLQSIKDSRDVPAIGGKHWSRIYADAYIAMLEAGGELEVLPFIGQELLYEKLQAGPVYANVSDNILNKKGRTSNTDATTHTSVEDDLNGRTYTHSVVIYGNDEHGNFLVADPWEGLRVVEPEHMVLAIAGAQIECDNQIFQVLEPIPA